MLLLCFVFDEVDPTPHDVEGFAKVSSLRSDFLGAELDRCRVNER